MTIAISFTLGDVLAFFPDVFSINCRPKTIKIMWTKKITSILWCYPKPGHKMKCVFNSVGLTSGIQNRKLTFKRAENTYGRFIKIGELLHLLTLSQSYRSSHPLLRSLILKFFLFSHFGYPGPISTIRLSTGDLRSTGDLFA